MFALYIGMQILQKWMALYKKLWHVDNFIWDMNLDKHCTNCTNLVNGACVALNGLFAILLQNYFSIQIFFKISSKNETFCG